MSIPSAPAAESRTRRTLLAGALGGLGAWVAGAAARTAPALAAVGDPLRIGRLNRAGQATTTLECRVSGAGFLVKQAGAGPALRGQATSGRGVVGVAGDAGTGVWGSSTDHIGVYGQATWGYGVFGISKGAATGVAGFARDRTGIGVSAKAGDSGGVALLIDSGRVKAPFISGVATIAAGNTQVAITLSVNVIEQSFVLLTPRVNVEGRDIWYETAPGLDQITIHISAARASDTPVGWLMIG